MDNELTTTNAGNLTGSRGRVLVVEDDHYLCCLLGERLELAGYQTVLSNNGLEGLRALEEKQPDLAIIDLNMPVMSGFRLLRLLRGRRSPDQPRVPVIVISGDDPQEIMDLVVETKPDDYLQKPFAAEQLLEKVGLLMARISA